MIDIKNIEINNSDACWWYVALEGDYKIKFRVSFRKSNSYTGYVLYSHIAKVTKVPNSPVITETYTPTDGIAVAVTKCLRRNKSTLKMSVENVITNIDSYIKMLYEKNEGNQMLKTYIESN